MGGLIVEAALREFVQTIEATGGVVEDGKGNYEPVADRDWIDLGHAYVRACQALDIPAQIVKGTEPYDDRESESTEEDVTAGEA